MNTSTWMPEIQLLGMVNPKKAFAINGKIDVHQQRGCIRDWPRFPAALISQRSLHLEGVAFSGTDKSCWKAEAENSSCNFFVWLFWRFFDGRSLHPLVSQYSNGKSPCLMENQLSMAIFHSYFDITRGYFMWESPYPPGNQHWETRHE